MTKEELRGKMEQVLGDDGIRERVRALRDATRRSIAEGGSSHHNLIKFGSSSRNGDTLLSKQKESMLSFFLVGQIDIH